MKARKNYRLDLQKIAKVKALLDAKTETEAIETAQARIIFEEEAWKAFAVLEGRAKHFDFSRPYG